MIIRGYTDTDLEDVKRVGNRYAKETILGQLTSDQFDGLVKVCMDSGVALVAEKENRVVGLIAARFLSDTPLGKIADELIWYVEPEHRGIGALLFERFLSSCKEAGCKGLAMVAYQNESFPLVERFYLRNGFKEIERRYYKEL